MLFVGLATIAVFSSVAMKVVGGSITAVEAMAVEHILGWFRDDVSRVGNVVGNPDTFMLIVMHACSSADGAPKAMLALVALSLFLGDVRWRAMAAAALVLGVVYVVANLVRLAYMASSGDAYTVGHGPTGAAIFDGGMVMLLLALTFSIADGSEAKA